MTPFATSTDYTLISQQTTTEVWLNNATQHHSLHAIKDFASGEVVTAFHALSVQDFPTYLTVQTGINEHIVLQPDFLQFVNHSCEPNAFFDTTRFEFITLREVAAGEELCFFYPSTEWYMAQSFVCNCGKPSCLQLITGAADLSKETLAKYKLSDFIMHHLAIAATNS